MAIRLGANSPAFRIGSQTPSRIFLGDRQVWPEFTPVTTQYTTGTTYNYAIPANCYLIDVILLGGGGGGQGMGNATAWGQGGAAGQWQYFTLRRGVDIPWSITAITGSLGAGGSAGAGGIYLSGGAGGNGGNTTATVSGYGTVTALGGAGGNNRNLDTAGKSPGTINWQGIDYVGGAEAFNVAGGSAAGNVYGGGGQAAMLTSGFFGLAGGAGARGCVWIRAWI
ncbi:hypothetical protein SEA_FAYELY_8 [Mycobacterium phage Fayely]|uniref:minor tail protein n=1 Tax=Mycobacterium phage Pioneer TaxID=1698417 RepID=UPI0006BCAD70|nr:minor tail protein [Mycobacterium phage Pioneer]AVI04224.1 hypothetical protein SEA_PHONNEGUT_8 [Mycobacterium phage Phonnegut]AZF93488.1 hypothetical protein SEA_EXPLOSIONERVOSA_8 [Mycobacterium phage ExplosioNervosa]QGJ88662.1 hypothetical protein SEA_BEEMO_8 [Mycobacterium phage Beemo]UVF60873.1 hypothetical protein SEA_FAYELY_8 [Mycobacterium phage Fayely]ALA07820.1 hypothetical protein SEA_PIONEER_8 [Mycobacterium phage Pioneer]